MSLLKKIICAAIACVMLFSICACGQKELAQDKSPLTMYVGLGNGGGTYYDELKEYIFNTTGVDVQFVYTNALDTSNYAINCIKNADLPADIMITASETPKAYQEGAFLDLAAVSNLMDSFKNYAISSASIDGAVYQLPFTSRLIGIGYNKTLLEEMGWELPETFDDMVALKEKADEAGINFSLSAGVATGHGFNYLQNIMATQFTSTIKGREWFDKWQAGEAGIDEFAQACGYFEKWHDAGLFGRFYDTDWNASSAAASTRCLFCFDILNQTGKYEGPLMDENGNEVEGVTLCDEWASMPFISEDGSNNNFVIYNNMYLALDRKLGENQEAEKLTKAIRVLDCLTTNEAGQIFTKSVPDGYLATKDFEIDDSRLYAAYKNEIQEGYIMPWFYNFFDADSVVDTGELVNRYLKDDSATMQEILKMLDDRNTAALNSQIRSLGTVENNLGYDGVAKLIAVAGARSLDSMIPDSVDVSLCAYVTDANLSTIPRAVQLPVAQSKLYSGDYEAIRSRTLVNQQSENPIAAILTGKELSSLIDTGYVYNHTIPADPDKGTEEKNEELKYDFAAVMREGVKIDNNSESTYVVAISKAALNEGFYEQLLEEGRIISDSEGNPISGSVDTAIDDFVAEVGTISESTLVLK